MAHDDSLPLLVVVDGETICLRDIRGEGRTSGGTVVRWFLTGGLLHIRSGLRTAAFDLNQISSITQILLRKQLTSLLSFNTYPELMGYLCSNGRPTSPPLQAGWKKESLSSAEQSSEEARARGLSSLEPPKI